MQIKSLIILLCAILLIVPAFAQTETIQAPEGKVIWAIDFDIPSDTEGSFTATLEDGTTVSGTFSYLSSITIVPLTASVNLGGDSSSNMFYTPVNLKMSLWHGDDVNYSRQLKLGYGQAAPWWSDVVVEDTTRSPIISFTMTADKLVGIDYEYKDATEAAGQLSGQKEQSLIDFMWATFWDTYNFLTAVYDWTIFFFVTNYQMILALFLAVPMAFAAKNSRGNPERFLRQYFRTLKGFFVFIIDMWRALIESIGTVRGWFRI